VWFAGWGTSISEMTATTGTQTSNFLGPRPEFDGYGVAERSEWLDVDWQKHLRSHVLNGARVNYVEMGDGPPVVLVHGLSGCWQNWLENIPDLARRHRVVALDLPGFGESELPKEEISIPGYGRFVDAFLGEIGIERASVIGNSMGGFIAAEASISHPSRVEKLVLVSAAGLVRVGNRQLYMLERAARLFHPATAAFLARREHLVRRPKLRRRMLYGVVRYPERIEPELAYEVASGAGKPGFLDALDAIMHYDFRDRLPELSASTLIVWGRNDRIVPVAGAYEYEQLIPNARRVIFEDTGHVPMLERPARFNRLVEEFFDE
jgi:pimeloyl-ACP methyl ester carboxylesterase